MISPASLLPRPAAAVAAGTPDQSLMPLTHSVGRTLLGYLLAAGLAIALSVLALRLWRADLRVAFIYEGDGCYYLAIVKTIAETGWYYHNDRIGQLGGLDYRDFPTSDGWAHLAIIRLLTAIDPDPALASNLFFLLTFPLTALTTLLVCRRLGMSFPVALVVALLFTFTPYHLMRVGHPFLAAYYLIPLSILVAVRTYQGTLPFRRELPGGSGDRWAFFTVGALGTVVMAVLTGMGGIYYAFFGCAFLIVAATARAWSERRWMPVLSAGLVCGITTAALAVTMWPSIQYKLTEPKNCEAARRCAWESETYGLKVTQLILPVTDHRYAPLRHLKARYNRSGTPLINENDTSALGLIGAGGFLFLLGRLLLRHGGPAGQALDGLALLTLFAVLLATVGGLGSAFSFLISPWIRAYNRISIFIALFALLAVGILLQQTAQRWSATSRRRMLFAIGLTAITAFGILDQTTSEQVPPYKDLSAQYAEDHRFVESIEAIAPHGGLVFELPYAFYPEGHLYNGAPSYHLFRPYLNSNHLRWTYGSLRGHLGDEWAKRLSRIPLEPMLGMLAQAEFAGIYIDRDGYADHGKEIEAQLHAVLRVEPLTSDRGRYSYFDLRPFTEKMRSDIAPAAWERRRDAALRPIVPLWRNGFHMEENFPDRGPGHWCSRSGELHLRNDLDRARVVRIRMQIDLPMRPGESTLHLAGAGWDESASISAQQSTMLEHRLILPPGNHVLRLECDAAALSAAEDPWRRKLVFRVTNLECDEELQGED